MGAPQKDTTAFHLRIEEKLRVKIELLQAKSDFRSANQFAAWLISEAAGLLDNPDQCPPLSPEFMSLRDRLHGRPGGTYADEPGRPASSGTVAGNMQASESTMQLLEVQSSLISRLEAEIARKEGEILRLRSGLSSEKKLYGNGGAA